MKKFLSLCLIVVLVFSMGSAAAFAQDSKSDKKSVLPLTQQEKAALLNDAGLSEYDRNYSGTQFNTTQIRGAEHPDGKQEGVITEPAVLGRPVQEHR